MKIDIITVFPEMFRGFLGESMIARAGKIGAASIRTVDLRDFSRDRRRTVDDKPYSGGPGMLMKPEVWFDAIETCLHFPSSPTTPYPAPSTKHQAPSTSSPAPSTKHQAPSTNQPRIILTTPTGARYTQRTAEQFAACEHLIFLCGHYEGFDERVKRLVTDEVSIGDFVLTGGEIPVAAMIDSTVRLLPGVLGGGAAATANESFGTDGLLEAPQYTRPPEFRGMRVPEILLSGDHAKMAGWRKRQAVDLTSRRRPDLLEVGGTYTNDV